MTLKKRYIRFISNIAHAFNIETHDMPKDDSAIFEACIWKDKLTEIYRHFFISLSQINTNDELVSTGSNNFESMTKQFTEEIAKIKSALKLKRILIWLINIRVKNKAVIQYLYCQMEKSIGH